MCTAMQDTWRAVTVDARMPVNLFGEAADACSNVTCTCSMCFAVQPASAGDARNGLWQQKALSAHNQHNQR